MCMNQRSSRQFKLSIRTTILLSGLVLGCLPARAEVSCELPNPKPPPPKVAWTCDDDENCGPLLCMCLSNGGFGEPSQCISGNCGINEQILYIGTCVPKNG